MTPSKNILFLILSFTFYHLHGVMAAGSLSFFLGFLSEPFLHLPHFAWWQSKWWNGFFLHKSHSRLPMSRHLHTCIALLKLLLHSALRLLLLLSWYWKESSCSNSFYAMKLMLEEGTIMVSLIIAAEEELTYWIARIVSVAWFMGILLHL